MGERHVIDTRVDDKCAQSVFIRGEEPLPAGLGRAFWILAALKGIRVVMGRETLSSSSALVSYSA